MANGHEKRIEALRVKQAQLDAEISRLKARSRIDARKADTRRKILIGAIMLQEMESSPKVDAWVRKMLGERLTRSRDRALFGMPVLESIQDNTPSSSDEQLTA